MAGERGPNFSEQEQLKPDKAEIIGLKEALAMLEQLEADDSVVLGIIDDALGEAIPELDDYEGWIAFRARMKAVAVHAQALDGATERSRLIKEAILSRLAELENPST